MARYGVVGDVHGNKEALLAVLGLLDRCCVRKLLCVGDIVGFNADSDACIAILRERGVESVAGNHDLISIGQLGTDRCSDKAAYALKRTRVELTPAGAEFLGALPRTKVLDGRFVLMHAGVHDVEQYLRTRAQVSENAALLEAACPGARVCFFGHTHEQRVFAVGRGSVAEIAAEGLVRLRPGPIYFINPGSVDAARKADAKLAECAVFDSTAATVQFYRVPYDHEAAEAKARARGYRIDPVATWLYSVRRQLRNRMRRYLSAINRIQSS